MPLGMTDLSACLSSGKGTWGHVMHLIEEHMFEKVFLITDDFGKQGFSKYNKNAELILVDFNNGIDDLVQDIAAQLKDKISGTEIGLNLASGSGKEHMAIMSAVMRLGVGFRLVAVTKDGVKEV